MARSVADLVDEDLVLELARGALRIPSLSGEEEGVARFFVDAMARVGMDAELQPVPATALMGPSFNAIGYMRGSGGGPTLLFNGHIDHNPVCDGWTKDPFAGTVEDGWLYGFVHMKAANACYVAAVDAVRRAGIPLAGDVAIAHVCGELRGGAGTRHALAQGLKADYFVLGEPTELELATNHAASMVLRINVLGRMKHFATVEVAGAKGANAAEMASRVVLALGGSHRPQPRLGEGGWLDFEPKPGFEGLPQLNVGNMRAGISREFNTTRPALFPDFCSITVDIRTVPGMTRESVRADLERLLDGLRAELPELRYEIEFANETFPLPFDAPRDSEVVRAVGRAHQEVNGKDATWSEVLRFAASDASWMHAAGIPGVIYGPTGRYLSRPDERCEVADLVRAAKAYACVIADLCAHDRR